MTTATRQENDDLAAVAALEAAWERIWASRPVGSASDLDELLRRWEPLRPKAPIALELDLLSPLGDERYEPAHTRVLAYLLDPRARHGLGDTALQRFLDAVTDAANEISPMSAPMHSLACFFRLGVDLDVLLDEGRSTPDGTAPEDWDAMWNVVDRAIEQAQACLRHGFGVLSTELLAAGLRFEPVTRAQTLVQKWEVSGRVFARHARRPLAYVGLSLGVDEPHLSVWWGYLRAQRAWASIGGTPPFSGRDHRDHRQRAGVGARDGHPLITRHDDAPHPRRVCRHRDGGGAADHQPPGAVPGAMMSD